MNKEELLQLIGESIKNGVISIKDIADHITPKKPRKTENQKAYYKEWYEKNKTEILEKKKINKLLKKSLSKTIV
jgi:hypothetical protein